MENDQTYEHVVSGPRVDVAVEEHESVVRPDAEKFRLPHHVHVNDNAQHAHEPRAHDPQYEAEVREAALEPSQ